MNANAEYFTFRERTNRVQYANVLIARGMEPVKAYFKALDWASEVRHKRTKRMWRYVEKMLSANTVTGGEG